MAAWRWLAGAMLASAAPAAAVVPVGTFGVMVYSDTAGFGRSGSSTTTPSQSFTGDTVSYAFAFAPNSTFQGTATPGGSFRVNEVTGSLSYDFGLMLAPGAPVATGDTVAADLTFVYHYMVASTGTDYRVAAAHLTYSAPGGGGTTSLVDAECDGFDGSGCTMGTASGTFHVTSGFEVLGQDAQGNYLTQTASFILGLTAAAGNVSTASVFVDPDIALDATRGPGGGDLTARTAVHYGPVVLAPSSPTPEPATWTLLITGFGTVGGALRGRRRARV